MRSMSLRSVLTALLAGGFLVNAAASAAESTWTYNGSSVLLVENGQNVTITYLEPRPMLRREGVKRGTVLLRGKVSSGTLTGTSYVFKQDCAPVAYEVSGSYQPGGGQTTFELSGVVPQRDPAGCAVVGNAAQRPSRLLFTRAADTGGAVTESTRGLTEDKGLVLREQACSGYTNPAEHEVCLDRELGKLDADMNNLYQRALKTLDAKGVTKLKSEQRAWLKERDACGPDGRCLSAAYKARISALEKQAK